MPCFRWELEWQRAAQESDPFVAASKGTAFQKALTGMQSYRDRRKTHPMDIYLEYEKFVLEQMHVMPGQPWQWNDWVKRMNFLKMKSVG